jgi:hypothetical protein
MHKVPVLQKEGRGRGGRAKIIFSHSGRHMPIIPALGRLKQEDLKLRQD